MREHRDRKEEERIHLLRHVLVSRTDLLSSGESLLGCVYMPVCVLGWTHKRKREKADKRGYFLQLLNQHVSGRRTLSYIIKDFLHKSHMCDVSYLYSFQPGQEEDEMQHPEVSEEDLTETINKLGRSGPAKSKTTEVMQECGEDTHINTMINTCGILI